MKRLKVAGCGTGYFSRFHYDAWNRIENVQLVGIANRTLSKAQEFAKSFAIKRAYDDVAEMLAETKPDVLDIITPPQTHIEFITLAAKAGVDVVCQKPFCENLQSAFEAVRIARDAGIKLTIHENFRFQPWYGAIKRELENDRLGKLYTIQFRLRPGDGQGPDAYIQRQPYFQTMERFLVHETGIHFIDVFRYLLGPIDEVYADLRQINPAIKGEDAGQVLFRFSGGARGIFDGNRLSDHSADNKRLTMGEMLLEGEQGTIDLNGFGELSFRPHGSNESQPIEYQWRDHHFGGDCVYHFQSHVTAHYLKGQPLSTTGVHYLTNLEVEDAIYRSAVQGKRIQIGHKG